ncbi:MAG: c-type cytochrome [Phycisphaeraceae bacterium]|nr:c-type cytochrome [Phycisphaeraceae bacterium]
MDPRHRDTRLDRGLPEKNSWRPAQGSGLGHAAKSVALACLLCVPILSLGALRMGSYWGAIEQARLAALEESRAHTALVSAPALPLLDAETAARGRDLFTSACVACHGAGGTGIAGLGADISHSPFVAARDDNEMVKFLIAGRPNAQPVGMPPRAGRDDLTDEDLHAIVTYVRGLQDPRRMPALREPVIAGVAPVTAGELDAALAAAGGDEELAEYIASGTKLFAASCTACHAQGGVGIKGNGPSMIGNAFVKSLDDDGLLAFLKRGRDPSDPKNTTGVGMPAKGGNPALDEDDLLDIIAYLRTLEKGSGSASAAK